MKSLRTMYEWTDGYTENRTTFQTSSFYASYIILGYQLLVDIHLLNF